MISTPSNSEAPTANEGGRYLLSLDSELPQDDLTVERAILVHSLFSRRVCASDSQVIDSPAFEPFCRKYEALLHEEVQRAKQLDYPPILGTLSRGGSDVSVALDLMLTPNPRTGLPSY